MASLRSSMLLAIVAAAGAGLGAAGQRPNLTEWQAQQAANAANASAATAKESKMAAVNKAVVMLESLKAQVMQEGEQEASTYNKFACFCKDTTVEKSLAVTQGEDAKLAITAEIGRLIARRNELDNTIKQVEGEIQTAEGEIKTAKATRTSELKVYTTNDADLAGAIKALEGALKSLKAAKNPSLAQLQAVAKTVTTAALIADALSIGGDQNRQTLAFFLQQAPTVPTEDYTFRSDSIIQTLEQLETDFRAEKVKVDTAEVAAVAAHEQFLQAKHDFIEGKERQLETARSEKQRKQEQIASNSQDLTTVAATLLDDQEYLMDLHTMCGDKARSWDQRVQVRRDELNALTAAVGILRGVVTEKTTGSTIRFVQGSVRLHLVEAVARSEAAMEAVEAATEAGEASGSSAGPAMAFLQRSRGRARGGDPDAGRQAVITLLRSKGAQLRSAALTALAGELSADRFAKVKQLLQELIERLKLQATREANQKGWCDQSTSAAEMKRNHAAEAIQELNGNLARLESLRDKLSEELTVLATEIQDLGARRGEAVSMRANEHAENLATIAEANQGRDAISQAITLLDRFYKTQAKATVSLMQNYTVPPRGLAPPPSARADAPDAGFGDLEAYKGAQGEAGGVIGMLEVIESDFKRTAVETQEAEAQAQQDHLVFMTETGKSLAQKTTAETERTRQKDDAEDKLQTDGDNLQSQTAILEAGIKELLQLREACQAGMSYEDRVARREEEIAALRKADCILENYSQYAAAATISTC